MQEIFVPLLSATITAIAGLIGAGILARVRSARLLRSIDQCNKIVEFVSRFNDCYGNLDKIPQPARNEAEQILLAVLQGIREDFDSERDLLPKFEQNNSSLRRLLLLHNPLHRLILISQVMFHVIVLFVLYVTIVRTIQRHWDLVDMSVVLFSFLAAVAIRLSVWMVSSENGGKARDGV